MHSTTDNARRASSLQRLTSLKTQAIRFSLVAVPAAAIAASCGHFTSDERLKQQIKTIERPLDALRSL